MSIFDSVLLGLIQGLTEFLPISSSGHLVLGQAVLKLPQDDIVFEVFVHFGTFLAVILAFRNEVGKMFLSFCRWLTKVSKAKELFASDEYFRLAVLILIGTIPAAVLGLALEKYFESIFSQPVLVSIMLLFTGALLLATALAKNKQKEVRLGEAIVMGIAQAIAIIPGISRSGSTISAGLFLGVEKVQAAKFSFLLSLPAILGATILKSFEIFEDPAANSQIGSLVIGTAVAFISGYAAIRILLDLIRRGKFSYFGIYCIILGIAGIIYFG